MQSWHTFLLFEVAQALYNRNVYMSLVVTGGHPAKIIPVVQNPAF